MVFSDLEASAVLSSKLPKNDPGAQVERFDLFLRLFTCVFFHYSRFLSILPYDDCFLTLSKKNKNFQDAHCFCTVLLPSGRSPYNNSIALTLAYIFCLAGLCFKKGSNFFFILIPHLRSSFLFTAVEISNGFATRILEPYIYILPHPHPQKAIRRSGNWGDMTQILDHDHVLWFGDLNYR